MILIHRCPLNCCQGTVPERIQYHQIRKAFGHVEQCHPPLKLAMSARASKMKQTPCISTLQVATNNPAAGSKKRIRKVETKAALFRHVNRSSGNVEHMKHRSRQGLDPGTSRHGVQILHHDTRKLEDLGWWCGMFGYPWLSSTHPWPDRVPKIENQSIVQKALLLNNLLATQHTALVLKALLGSNMPPFYGDICLAPSTNVLPRRGGLAVLDIINIYIYIHIICQYVSS